MPTKNAHRPQSSITRAKYCVAVGAQVDRTADHAQRKIVVDRQRPCSRAAAAPGRQTVLAHRAPSLAARPPSVAARSTTSGSPARGSIRFSSWLLPSSWMTSSMLPLRAGQHRVGALAARQMGVHGHATNVLRPETARWSPRRSRSGAAAGASGRCRRATIESPFEACALLPTFAGKRKMPWSSKAQVTVLLQKLVHCYS